MKKNQMVKWLSILLFSLIVVLLSASHTSPVYDLLLGDYGKNTASAAMVIGKGWVEGVGIPYKDFFLMGGPLYFGIQAFGWLLAGRTGIFILEVISFAIFLGLLIGTAKRFAPKKAIAVGLLSGVYIYVALCSAGNSTFEWCLPFIAGSCYIAFQKKKIWNCRDMFLLGILCGGILLIDFRAGGLSYGMIAWSIGCALQTFKSDGWKRIVSCMLGIILPIVAAVCIFASLGSLEGMLQGTFIYPMCALFSGFDDILVIAHKGVKSLLLLPMFLAGARLLYREKQFPSFGSCMLFCSVACGIFMLGGDNQWYYYLATLPAVILGITFICAEEGNRNIFVLKVFSVILILGIAIVPLKSYLTFLMDGVPDVKNEFLVDAQSFEEENPDYRYFALDTDNSYFLKLNKMPEYRYFANQTELSSYNSDIAEEVEGYLSEGNADIVFITEKGYIGRDLENYTLTQVYLKYGGSLFVYVQVE